MNTCTFEKPFQTQLSWVEYLYKSNLNQTGCLHVTLWSHLLDDLSSQLPSIQKENDQGISVNFPSSYFYPTIHSLPHA